MLLTVISISAGEKIEKQMKKVTKRYIPFALRSQYRGYDSAPINRIFHPVFV